MTAEPVVIDTGQHQVSGLWLRPVDATSTVVLAHGAGGGMRQRFLEATAKGLAERNVATLRYQFPYMEAGKARTDPPAICAATVRAAVETAASLAPGLPLFAGGKSFGGRMSSTAASETPLPGVLGLIFLGFPLHPPGKPGVERAAHLEKVTVPMLFLQGSKDDFAKVELLLPVVDRLGGQATLSLFEDADHSFHVPKASGQTDSAILRTLLDDIATWTSLIAAQ